MHQIDNSTAQAVMPTRKPPGTPGFFTQGNQASGQLATIVEADILNAIMMEISNVITRAGLTLNKLDDTQLWNALQALLHGPAGGDLQGTYPNPTFNLGLSHAWGAVQRFAGGVAGRSDLFWILNNALTTINLSLDDAGNLATRGSIASGTTVTANNGNVLAINGKLRASLGSGGDSNAATLLSEFPFSVAQNGYAKLPNGLILQWGLANVGVFASGGGMNDQGVAFNITFPTGLLWSGAMPNGSFVQPVAISTRGSTPSAFVITTVPGAGVAGYVQPCAWLALGY